MWSLVVLACSMLGRQLCWLKMGRRLRSRRITPLSFLQIDVITSFFLTLTPPPHQKTCSGRLRNVENGTLVSGIILGRNYLLTMMKFCFCDFCFSLFQSKLNQPDHQSRLKWLKKIPIRAEHLTIVKKVIACLFIVITCDAVTKYIICFVMQLLEV